MGKGGLSIALVGFGYWGRNIARVISQKKSFQLACICDVSPNALDLAGSLYPGVKLTDNYQELPAGIDAVCIVTPTNMHYKLAKFFLDRQKHVLLAKPMCRTLDEAKELFETANKNQVTLFVDHTFVFNSAVRKLKELLPRIGKAYFVTSERMNLALYQDDDNVIFDLMPHDISIVSYLFNSPIQSAKSIARCLAGDAREDFAHTYFETESGIMGTITVSSLAASKVRRLTITGSDGVLVYDDTDFSAKVKLISRGQEEKDMSRPVHRSGDLYSPILSDTEALATEMDEWETAISNLDVRRFYDRLNLDIMRGLSKIHG